MLWEKHSENNANQGVELNHIRYPPCWNILEPPKRMPGLTDSFFANNLQKALMAKENTIVGITGPSGSGKSTIMKLLIKMYPLQDGEIYIDGVNVKDIDSFYLRKEVTYISQNSKLFDQKVIENMMYGCMDMEQCSIYLNKMGFYPKKIQKLSIKSRGKT